MEEFAAASMVGLGPETHFQAGVVAVTVTPDRPEADRTELSIDTADTVVPFRNEYQAPWETALDSAPPPHIVEP